MGKSVSVKSLGRRVSAVACMVLVVVAGSLCTGCVEELLTLDALLSGDGYGYYGDDYYGDEYYGEDYYGESEDDGTAGDLISTYLGNFIEY